MRPIGLSLPIAVRLLLRLATRRATLGVVLRGRGDLAALNPAV